MARPVVLHVAESIGAGVGTFLRLLTSEAALGTKFEHVIFCGKREMPEDVQSSFRNASIGIWEHSSRQIAPVKDILAFLELRRFITSLKPDILHLHSAKAGLLGRVAARTLGFQDRTLYTPHGVAFANPAQRRSVTLAYREFEKLGARFGGEIVACSPSEAHVLARAGIRSTTIENGIPVLSAAPDAVGAPSGGRSDRAKAFTLITVGRIVAQKNPERFNAIAERFRAKDPFKFVWIGDGPLRQLLKAPNIEVTGWIDHSALDPWFAKADAYLSTADYEGLPYAVLEAMRARLPLLLTDVVGNRDLVRGENGLLFEDIATATDWMWELHRDRKRLASMANESFAVLRVDFNLERTAKAYAELYETLLCGSAG